MMSGLEVVGVFGVAAGIISAFHDSLSLYRSWKQKKKEQTRKKKERRRNLKNESLEQSLSLGETKIQQEYNLHFARLGQRFAIGDCEF